MSHRSEDRMTKGKRRGEDGGQLKGQPCFKLYKYQILTLLTLALLGIEVV